MKGQTAVEYLMTYGWAILIILIVAGVLAYYGIFAPSGFLGPTARGFGQVQVLNPWSLSAANGVMTLNVENRVGGTIELTKVNYTLTTGGTGSFQNAITDTTPLSCPTGCGVGTNLSSGGKGVLIITPTSGWTTADKKAGDSWTATITLYYNFSQGEFSTTGTLSGTYS
jgi:hypothetical protein